MQFVSLLRMFRRNLRISPVESVVIVQPACVPVWKMCWRYPIGDRSGDVDSQSSVDMSGLKTVSFHIACMGSGIILLEDKIILTVREIGNDFIHIAMTSDCASNYKVCKVNGPLHCYGTPGGTFSFFYIGGKL